MRSKKTPPPPDMPPLPTEDTGVSQMTAAQVKESLDQVLASTLKDLMEIAEYIHVDHGLADSQAFLMNIISSVVASSIYSTISGPSKTAKRDYRVLKNNIQEAVAGGFHGAFFNYAPKAPTDFICRVEVMPEAPSNLNH